MAAASTAVLAATPAAYAPRCTMLLVHGEEDEFVPPAHSHAFAAALEAAGAVDHALHIVKGGGHGAGFEQDRLLPSLETAQRFLEEEHLRGRRIQASMPLCSWLVRVAERSAPLFTILKYTVD
jgi:dienelactone hydrolase